MIYFLKAALEPRVDLELRDLFSLGETGFLAFTVTVFFGFTDFLILEESVIILEAAATFLGAVFMMFLGMFTHKCKVEC